MSNDFVRPRLVLVTTPLADGEAGRQALGLALSSGDVASVIVEPAGREGAAYQAFAEGLVEVCAEHEVAVLVANDTRVAGRVKADGFHLSSGDLEELRESVKRFAPRQMVGVSGLTTRHDALEAGELLPDYVLFGRFGGDVGAEPAADDLALAEWWAAIVEVPCIVLAGRDVESARAAAETGAEFVALSAAVFADPSQAGAAVARANEIFDEVASGRAAA